jgi:hypothetical protein
MQQREKQRSTYVLFGFPGRLPMCTAATKGDPACAGQGCRGSNSSVTRCADPPFDRDSVVRSAPFICARESLGMVQLWTRWAQAVVASPHILLNATPTLPSTHRRSSCAIWNNNRVASPQVCAPALLRQASGCASLIPGDRGCAMR